MRCFLQRRGFCETLYKIALSLPSLRRVSTSQFFFFFLIVAWGFHLQVFWCSTKLLFTLYCSILDRFSTLWSHNQVTFNNDGDGNHSIPQRWRKRLNLSTMVFSIKGRREYRCLTAGTVSRVGNSFLKNRCSEVKKNEPLVAIRPPSSLCNIYSWYRYSSRRHTAFTSYNSKANQYNKYVRNIPVLSRHNTITHHAQLAWKSFSQIRSNSGPAFSRRNTMRQHDRISCQRFLQRSSYSGLALPVLNWSMRAVILALNRYPSVINVIIASIVGTASWTQRNSTLADEYIPIGDSLYTHAQDGQMYLTSFFSSVLEGFVLFMRAIYLIILFSPTIVMAPFANSFGGQFRKKWLHLVQVTLEKAGPAFIKWGQWAATRPDLFPRDLCIELSKLHSKAPEHSFAFTKKTIEKAFGRKLPDIFDDFEEAPVASGSVAQVHRATLRFRYPGKQAKPIVVAVKVRHPGVSESIRKDFVIIHFFAKISSFIPKLKWLRLDESVQQFAVFMMSQVDLSREAAQLSRFIYNFRKSKYVSFPKPLYPLVHPAVLVETYEKGESVSRYIDDDDELEGDDQTKRALADIGTHALLKMLLEDNFIHADMHPGNILVREALAKPNRKWYFKSKPHVIFLDVGMTAELSRSDQLNLREFFKAVAIRDGQTAAECTLRFSKKQNCPNPKAFIEEVEKSFSFWGTKEGDVIHPADCMHQLLEQIRRHKVNIDGNACTVMVTTLVLEGWQRKLDPDYNVMNTLQTLLFKAGWVEDLVYTINELI